MNRHDAVDLQVAILDILQQVRRERGGSGADLSEPLGEHEVRDEDRCERERDGCEKPRNWRLPRNVS